MSETPSLVFTGIGNVRSLLKSWNPDLLFASSFADKLYFASKFKQHPVLGNIIQHIAFTLKVNSTKKADNSAIKHAVNVTFIYK